MKKTILIACLGLVSLGLQAQSISLAGEWNVELGKSGSAFSKSKRASQGEVESCHPSRYHRYEPFGIRSERYDGDYASYETLCL